MCSRRLWRRCCRAYACCVAPPGVISAREGPLWLQEQREASSHSSIGRLRIDPAADGRPKLSGLRFCNTGRHLCWTGRIWDVRLDATVALFFCLGGKRTHANSTRKPKRDEALRHVPLLHLLDCQQLLHLAQLVRLYVAARLLDSSRRRNSLLESSSSGSCIEFESTGRSKKMGLQAGSPGLSSWLACA